MLLELCLDHLSGGKRLLLKLLKVGTAMNRSPDLYRSITAQSVPLQLFARLDSVIEHNISLDLY